MHERALQLFKKKVSSEIISGKTNSIMAVDLCSRVYHKSCHPGKLMKKQPLFLTASPTATVGKNNTSFSLVSCF